MKRKVVIRLLSIAICTSLVSVPIMTSAKNGEIQILEANEMETDDTETSEEVQEEVITPEEITEDVSEDVQATSMEESEPQVMAISEEENQEVSVMSDDKLYGMMLVGVTANTREAKAGEVVTFIPNVTPGYKFVKIKVVIDSTLEVINLTDESNLSITMPASDITVFLYEEPIGEGVYGIEVQNIFPEQGTIDCQVTAVEGEQINFTVNPASGYEFDSARLFVNHDLYDTISTTSFTMPANNVTIRPYFKEATVSSDYSIEVVENMDCGDVTLSKTTANAGDSVSLSVNAFDGYEVESVKVIDANGNEVNLSNNSFTMPSGNVTIQVNYKESKVSHRINTSVENGAIIIDEEANEGETVSFAVTPNEGYELDSIKVIDVNGANIAVSDNSFVMPNSDVEITVSFKEIVKEYVITMNPTVNGTVTSSVVKAKEGDKVTLTVTPDEGYKLLALVVEDLAGNMLEVSNNSFTMPKGSVSVSAIFVEIKQDYEIVVEDVEHGIISADKNQAKEGEIVSLSVNPEEGYESAELKVYVSDTGKEVVVNDNTFVMPKGKVVVTGSFTKKEVLHSITVTEASNGTVTVDKSEAKAGEVLTIDAEPDEGYHIASIKAIYGGKEYDLSERYMTMPDEDVTITVIFERDAQEPTVTPTPSTPVKPSTPSNGNNNTSSGSNTNSNTSSNTTSNTTSSTTNKSPKTADTTDTSLYTLLLGAGAAIMTCFGVGSVKRKKKINKDEN